MSKPPHYWTKAKKALSRKDKVMKKLINNYKDGNLITRNDVFFFSMQEHNRSAN